MGRLEKLRRESGVEGMWERRGRRKERGEGRKGGVRIYDELEL